MTTVFGVRAFTFLAATHESVANVANDYTSSVSTSYEAWETASHTCRPVNTAVANSSERGQPETAARGQGRPHDRGNKATVLTLLIYNKHIVFFVTILWLW